MTAELDTWLILREPGKVPVQKGPFAARTIAATLREFMKERPNALITVLTWHDGGPSVQDGPECLEMIDGRAKHIAARHRRSTREAFGRTAV
ncbi:hypothetical protein [Pseudorhodoplanes sp.]|uniref:hypothetical protein n=1 Tax=Pseudorhodoplanes sp. TaxID=1934341 RepID=UPI002CC46DE6|nr:hypothetical protein [Pseudorhodoplanes sp.]HWV44159.1 hypothetical protein [Pseudorhodoplanes sp.]